MSKSSRQVSSTLELKPSYINDVRLEMDHPPFQVQAEFHDSILNQNGCFIPFVSGRNPQKSLSKAHQ